MCAALKKSILAIIIVIPFACFSSEPDTTRNIFEKGLDKVKLQKARHLYMVHDYLGALAVFEELYRTSQGNPMLSYRMGECHFKMKNYQAVVNALEKAVRINEKVHKKLHLLYGKAWHRLNELDNALKHYLKFKEDLNYNPSGLKAALSNNKYLAAEVEILMRGVKLAEEMQAKPVPVTITNVGEEINSPHEDYGPSISADGQTMIFTSRRPDSRGGLLSTYDHKYYEDIYITTWLPEDNKWDIAEGIRGRLNTNEHDASLSISPDGTQIFVYKNIEGVTKSGDIYVSKQSSSSGKWMSPRPLSKTINSSYFESHASVTADGKTIFFISERKGGFGQGDIYMAKRISRREWGEAQNLGEVINTQFDELSVFIHPDGNKVFFSSTGHETMGGYDIFMSKKEDGNWSKPVNLGYPINTVGDDIHFVLRADGKKAFYSNFLPNEGLGGRDIYEIDFSNYNILNK